MKFNTAVSSSRRKSRKVHRGGCGVGDKEQDDALGLLNQTQWS